MKKSKKSVVSLFILAVCLAGCPESQAQTSGSAQSTYEPYTFTTPSITAQPQDQTVNVGTNVTLRVTATGTAPLSYQWLFNGTPILGQTNAILALTNVQTAQAGLYAVRVSNPAGTVTSLAVSLTVNPLPVNLNVVSPAEIAGQYYALEGDITARLASVGSITGLVVYAQPPDLCGPVQNAASLRGNIALIDRGTCLFSDKIQAAQDAGAIAVIMVNNVEGEPIIMGGTSSTITIPGVMISRSDGALLKAHLTEHLQVRLSAFLGMAPVISRPLDSGVWLEGAVTNLSVQASGEPPLCFQWYFNGQQVIGATNSVYVIPSVSASNAGTYMVIVTNAIGAVTNEPVTLGVNNVVAANFLGLVLTAPKDTPLQIQSAPSIHGPWSALADLTLLASPYAYLDFTATNAQRRFYRTQRIGGALQPDRIEAWLFPGWTLNTPIGSRHRIEYVNVPAGFTNWQFLTNLTLPASPYLFIDTTATNKWPRYYRTTPLP